MFTEITALYSENNKKDTNATCGGGGRKGKKEINK